jgi:2-polyprenyl-3-methyl-5-hydroxy-6-metoxy-1,4-benzoquinol methylase
VSHPAGARPRVLDVGCGVNKYAGAIGIDRIAGTRADVLCDLDSFPYPFRDGTFDEVRAVHVIEHVSDVIRTMEEFHRLLREGGEVYIATPHYTDFSSFCDPTHRWHLNSFSLRYWEHYLCFVVRGKVIEWHLVKEGRTDARAVAAERLAPAQSAAPSR